MCGICGIIHEDRQASVSAELLDAMTDSLVHRGPDGRGIHLDGHVGLGHRRLSIIDLVTGDQPMYNEDRSVVIVFNGEIYNYKEIQPELRARRHHLASQSDTEVILHLYEDYGDDCVHHLNGMFAFAIWDKARMRLLAARDRLGERPFYYCIHQGRFLFGSEMKAILKDPSIPRKVDLKALDDFLAYGYIPAPLTIFEGVYKLPAAHRLIWEQGRIRTERYWQVEFPDEPRRSDTEYVEELRALLVDSIRLRLRSDVPIGAFLSGGIDSNGIVALASMQLDHPLKTFTVGFGEQDYDETAMARLTAQRYHTEHHEIIIRDRDITLFEDLVGHFDEPFGDPSMLPTYAIARQAGRFVKVCLSGDAGDEVFAGYTHYRKGLKYMKFDTVPTGIRRMVFGTLSAMMPEAMWGKGLLGRLASSGARRYQRLIGIFNVEERRRLMGPDAGHDLCADARLFEEIFDGRGRDPLSTFQLADQLTYLPEDINVKVDRCSMKNSLETRIPFLDHRLIERVNAMPSDLKLRNGQQKYVLKRVIADVVPPEILGGAKRGFGVPLKYWFRQNLKLFARDLLLSASSRSRAYFEPRFVERLLASHDVGGRDLSDRIWALLVFEQWCRCLKV